MPTVHNVAEIAQIRNRTNILGWTNPAMPGWTLFRGDDGLFWVSNGSGHKERYARGMPMEGWTAIEGA